MNITDNHFHLDPRGRQNLAVREFMKAGGTRLVLVHKPYSSWFTLNGFIEDIDTTLTLAKKAREEGAKVAVVAAPHPIELLKLSEKLSLDKAQDLYLDCVSYCSNLVSENVLVGLGELGRPHFPVENNMWNFSNKTLLHSLQIAKDVDAAVVLHTESADSSVMKDLASIADKSSFPKNKLVKHYGGPAALENSYGLQVSILASKSNINTSAQLNLPFMMETDYLDDPNRPGAVLGPKTVPKRTKLSLENNLINEDTAYQIHESLPDLIYKSFN